VQSNFDWRIASTYFYRDQRLQFVAARDAFLARHEVERRARGVARGVEGEGQRSLEGERRPPTAAGASRVSSLSACSAQEVPASPAAIRLSRESNLHSTPSVARRREPFPPRPPSRPP